MFVILNFLRILKCYDTVANTSHVFVENEYLKHNFNMVEVI